MKKKKILKSLFLLLVFAFLFSYFLEKTGYYQYNLQNQKNLTEAEIKRFDADVKAGKAVDITDYLKSNKVDYSSKLTKTTSNFSLKMNEFLKSAISNTFNIFGKLLK